MFLGFDGVDVSDGDDFSSDFFTLLSRHSSSFIFPKLYFN